MNIALNIAQTIPLADSDSWGMHGDFGAGWWIVMVAMMLLFIGAIVFAIAWMGRASARGWSPPWEGFATRENPVETLERRFAEGAISVEEYRARREALVNGAAEPNADHEDEPLTAPRGEGRQS
jgi:uncharacterized membrane protein